MSLLGYTTKFHYDMETPRTEDSQCKLTKTSQCTKFVVV